MDIFNVLSLFGGLAMFLYGMRLMGDSLKEIANYFNVSIDSLLSGDELLCLAEEDSRQKQQLLCDLVFGSLDCSAAMVFFLPFFGSIPPGVALAGCLDSSTTF